MKESPYSGAVVTNFPSHVQKNGRHGLFVQPFIAKSLARILDGRFIPAVNGIDSYEPERINDFSEFSHDSARFTGVSLEKDAYKDWEDISGLFQNLSILQEKGLISVQKRKIIFCGGCGKVEFLTDTMVSLKYAMSGKCQFCNSELTEVEKDVLIYHVSNDLQISDFQMEPEKFSREIEFHFSKLKSIDYLVSRTRNTTLRYAGFWIDPDFFWSSFLSRIPSGGKPVILIGTKKISWRIALILSLYKDTSGIAPGEQASVFVPYLLSETKSPLGNDLRKNRMEILGSLNWGSEYAQWRSLSQREFCKKIGLIESVGISREAEFEYDTIGQCLRNVLSRRAIDAVGGRGETKKVTQMLKSILTDTDE